MLRDEIGLQQEAAKKREQVLIWLLLAIVLLGGVAAAAYFYRKFQGPVETGPQQAVSFAGRSLQLPPLWLPYLAGTSQRTLVLTPEGVAPTPNSRTITLEDEREHAELPEQFVSGWLKAPREADSTIRSLVPFYDAAANAVGASCIRINYGGAARPLKIICLSHDGRWKATLSGSERDIRPLDSMVEQFTGLEN